MTIDKSQLYGLFEESMARRDKLSDLATRKALDLPLEDDVNIIQNTTHQGMSRVAAVLLSLAMLGSGGGLAVGLAALAGWLSPQRRDAPASVNTPTALPETQEYRVTFWDDDERPIAVEKNEANIER